VKWLLDNNLSFRLAGQLQKYGIEVEHVGRCGLSDVDDAQIFQYAGAHDMILISKDDDFLDLAAMRGRPPLVVKLDIGNLSTSATLAVLLRNKADIDAAYGEKHIRVLRLYMIKEAL
jgi:predicted nuclease of predicted toxin-antitoxin system